MPGASLISGLLGSVNASIDEQHKRADAKVHDQRETERAILTHLTSSPDPEIAGRALSALAEWSAGAPAPKGGFLNRMITGGETAMHPAVRSVLDLMHTPGELDVQAGRATAAPAAGGAPAVGPSPGSRGGTPAAGGPVGAPPPAVTPPTGMAGVSFAPKATPQAGSAAQPAQAATEPGGGPASPAAGGSPTGAPPQVAPGMAGVSFLPQTKTATPPPAVNTPLQPSPAGPPPNVAPAGGPAGAPLPVAGQPAGPGFFRLTDYRPQDAQRLANQVHAEGLGIDMQAKVDAITKIGQARGWSPDELDQAVRAKLGVLPKGAVHEGEIVPDPGSATGYSQIIYNNAGAIIARLPAQNPAAKGAMTPDRQLARQMFNKELADLTPPELAKLAVERDHRAVNLAGRKDEASQTAQTNARADRTSDVTLLFPDGTTASGLMTGQGELLDKTGKPVPPDVIRVATSAALPPKLDTGAKQMLYGINMMRTVNQRIRSLIEQAGEQNDNNPLPVKFDQWLYNLGVDPGMLNGIPFSDFAQLTGMSEAAGLRSLVGGRPNQTLLDIYKIHLPQTGQSPQLTYQKLQELDTILGDSEGSITKAQSTRLAPNTRPGGAGGAGGGGPVADVQMKDKAGVVHAVHPDDVAKALAAGWTKVG